MHGTKLLQLVKTLSKKELKAFTKYLKANYASSASLVKLFEHIESFYGDWESSDLQLDHVSTALKQANNTKAISNKSSDLYKILLDYLVKKELDTEEYTFEKNTIILGILEKRNLDKLRAQKWNAIKKAFDQNKKVDSWTPVKEIQINELNYYKKIGNKYDASNKTLRDSIELLHQFELGLKSKYACEILYRSQFLTSPHDEKLYSFILNTVPSPDNFFQHIFHTLFKTLYTSSLPLYRETFQLLKDSDGKISEKDKQIIFLHLINFSAKQSRKNQQPYGTELLALFKFGLETKILVKDQQITRVRFHNIVDVACKTGDIEFGRNFIRDYQKYLPTNQIADTVILAKAIISFAEKDFEGVQERLSRMNFKYVDEKFRAQSLILSSFFELQGNSSTTWDKCHAFKAFLDRKNTHIGKNFLAGYRTYINTIEKLMREELEKSEIQRYIVGADNIVMKFWLLEKLKSYRKKY